MMTMQFSHPYGSSSSIRRNHGGSGDGGTGSIMTDPKIVPLSDDEEGIRILRQRHQQQLGNKNSNSSNSCSMIGKDDDDNNRSKLSLMLCTPPNHSNNTALLSDEEDMRLLPADAHANRNKSIAESMLALSLKSSTGGTGMKSSSSTTADFSSSSKLGDPKLHRSAPSLMLRKKKKKPSSKTTMKSNSLHDSKKRSSGTRSGKKKKPSSRSLSPPRPQQRRNSTCTTTNVAAEKINNASTGSGITTTTATCSTVASSSTSKVQRLEAKLMRLKEKLNKIERNNKRKQKKINKRLDYAKLKQNTYREKQAELIRLNSGIAPNTHQGSNSGSRRHHSRHLQVVESSAPSSSSRRKQKAPPRGKFSRRGSLDTQLKRLDHKQRYRMNCQEIKYLKKDKRIMEKEMNRSLNFSSSIHNNNNKLMDNHSTVMGQFQNESIPQHMELMELRDELMDQREYLHAENITKHQEVVSMDSQFNLQSTIRQVLESTLLDAILPITEHCRSVKLQKDIEKIAIECQNNASKVLDDVEERYPPTTSTGGGGGEDQMVRVSSSVSLYTNTNNMYDQDIDDDDDHSIDHSDLFASMHGGGYDYDDDDDESDVSSIGHSYYDDDSDSDLSSVCSESITDFGNNNSSGGVGGCLLTMDNTLSSDASLSS